MSGKLSRQKLIELVENIVNADGSEEEIDDWITMVDENVPHPNISDLIFYPDEELTPEEIVDKAMGYRPIQL